MPVSVLSVPALSGMYFLFAKIPAIATGPMIGKISRKYHHKTTHNIPERYIITKPLKTTTIIGRGRSELIQHFTETRDNRDCPTNRHIPLGCLHKDNLPLQC